MTEAIARRFQQALQSGDETRKLRTILEMVPKEDLVSWTDENGLDLLHHCILQNDAEIVDLLLKQGYFARPYEPKLNTYTHLAAFLGFRATVTVLLQHRPDDFRVSQMPLLIPQGYVPPETSSRNKTMSGKVADTRSSGIKQHVTSAGRQRSSDKVDSVDDVHNKRQGRRSSSGITVAGLVTDGSKALGCTPLEVAARARSVECVRVMLDVCVLKAHPDAPNKGYLTLAALGDCPSAMKLLLENSKRDKQTTEDFKAAVEICVQRARPECLDLLLGNTEHNMAAKGLFKNINLYHVLYSFSATYGKGAYGRLPEATRVLIRHGHDVKSKVPPRTYPLYTLLTHSFCFHDYSFTQYYLQCIRLLLSQGADPNFDEVHFEKRLLQQKGIKFAAGRNAYSSALHCLLETVEMYASQMSSKALAIRFVEECADILVKHKADVGKVGRIGDGLGEIEGNVLHQYAKTCVTLGVDKAILRTILRFGAEPDIKVNGKYALNVYFDKLFELLTLCEVVDTRHKYEDDVNNMLTFMCRYMTSAHITEAALIFKRSHNSARSEQVKYYVKKVFDDLQERSKHVRPLQRLAAWKMWKLCGKRADIVRELPVKVELKTVILPLV